jgi:hypothetical protein
MKKYLLLIAPLLLAACTPDESLFKSDVPVSRPAIPERVMEVKETNAQSGNHAPVKIPEPRPLQLPNQINLDVPFYPQAPDANWVLPWEEACEEASVVLAYYYFSGEPLSKAQFKKEVLDLVDWQMGAFGDYIHTTVDQTVKMLIGHYGFSDLRVMENPSVDDLKRELAQGHLIVAPFAGRELNNPFYSGEGPYYHMLVIKGYDESHFITNDVGTKRGLDFIYPYQTIMDALHDYHPTSIESAPSRVIILE